ncbi:light-regulated protein-like [Iris pallida]|uniref:Light-regulated protein-like n=1 Tax=Iris pallida TaxID=29817 RepID=A0AAX6EAA3_IRIPA|nr:light-regulated protein-like [Iris pallida]
MQAAAVCFTGALPIKKSTKSLVPKTSTKIQRKTLYYPKAVKVADTESASTVDYSSSLTSVFPAEACETIGGEACNVEMYPEAKLEASANRGEASVGSEEVEREYLEYDQSKTVFPGEACDDLGGEFCDPEYQAGVYKEKTSSN